MTLWPVFVFLVIVFIIYFIVIKNRMTQAMNDIHEMNQDSKHERPSDPNVIDVEVLDEREEK